MIIVNYFTYVMITYNNIHHHMYDICKQGGDSNRVEFFQIRPTAANLKKAEQGSQQMFREKSRFTQVRIDRNSVTQLCFRFPLSPSHHVAIPSYFNSSSFLKADIAPISVTCVAGPTAECMEYVIAGGSSPGVVT